MQLEDPGAGLRLLYCTPEKIVSSKRFFAKVWHLRRAGQEVEVLHAWRCLCCIACHLGQHCKQAPPLSSPMHTAYTLPPQLEKIYKAGRLRRIAIDEAHCASQWGVRGAGAGPGPRAAVLQISRRAGAHTTQLSLSLLTLHHLRFPPHQLPQNDFRPDYKKLGVLKQQFPDTPIIALTATATQAVRCAAGTQRSCPGARAGACPPPITADTSGGPCSSSSFSFWMVSC